jgi:thiamine-monophosphate kinase
VANGKARLEDLLTGGDDYQTLFTAPPSARAVIEAVGVTRIGVVEAGAGVRVVNAAGQAMVFEQSGFKHFRAKPEP